MNGARASQGRGFRGRGSVRRGGRYSVGVGRWLLVRLFCAPVFFSSPLVFRARLGCVAGKPPFLFFWGFWFVFFFGCVLGGGGLPSRSLFRSCGSLVLGSRSRLCVAGFFVSKKCAGRTVPGFRRPRPPVAPAGAVAVVITRDQQERHPSYARGKKKDGGATIRPEDSIPPRLRALFLLPPLLGSSPRPTSSERCVLFSKEPEKKTILLRD